MTDEEIYVPMESNNLEQNAEVIIDFGGDTIIDNFSKRSLLNELSKRVSFALEEKAQLEALKCLSQLNFHEKSKKFFCVQRNHAAVGNDSDHKLDRKILLHN